MQSAHFAIACVQHSTEMFNLLSELLDELGGGENVGVEPYQVPRRLIDPKFRRWCFGALTCTDSFLGLETCCWIPSCQKMHQIFTHLLTKSQKTILRLRKCGRRDLLSRRFPILSVLRE